MSRRILALGAVAAMATAFTPLTGQEYAHYPVDPDKYVDTLRAAAPGLGFIRQGELAFGRHGQRSAFPASDLARKTAFEAALRLQMFEDQLLSLLDKPEGEDSRAAANVRLLAAYALYRTADPRHLPRLGAMRADDGKVEFMPPYSFALSYEGEVMPKLARADLPTTTVGEEVASWLQHGWQAPTADQKEDFDAWCTKQVELAPTAVALRLRMTFATGGSLTSGSCDADELVQVYTATRSAPPGAREVALLGLFHDRYEFCSHRVFDSEADLCLAARRLGPDNLLAAMREEPVTVAGKQVEAERIEGFANGVMAFVLARPLACGLSEAHTDALLKLARSGPRADAYAAAAQLRPSAAVDILREGMRKMEHPFLSTGSAQLAIALYELGSPEHTAELSTWFHGGTEAAFIPNRKQPFVQHLLTRGRPRDHAMFRQLVDDPRFDRCDPTALRMTIHWLEQGQFEPVVPPESQHNFMHPSGLDRAWQDLDAAREAWPAQTAEMEKRMQLWRECIRKHVANW